MNREKLRQTPCGRFRLGERWINPEANDIDGARVEAKSMDVLVALVEAAPSVVSGAALLDRVWPNVVVVDNVVYQAVAQLRKALGDDPHAPRYIENIPRRGYRLIAPIERGTLETRVIGAGAPPPAASLPSVVGRDGREHNDKHRTRIATFAAAVCLVAGLGFAFRTQIGVWMALHVAPITSQTIDQHIAFATTSDGVRIAYATSGAGPPLVMTLGWFTHLEKGLLSPSYDSAGQLRWFSRDHLVVRYDGRGFGLSDHNVTDFSLEARVRDLEAVVDALGLERFAIDAFSAGGPTAVTYAARHPERVTRLILLGTFMNNAFVNAVDPVWTERYAASNRMWALARTDWDKPAARAAMVEWVHPKASEVERRVLMELYRVSADGPTFANFAAVVPDASESARQLRVPTLVVAGTEDTELPVEAGSQLAAAIPGARFELLEGADHFETIGHDARVLQLVSSFLDEETRANGRRQR